MLIKWLTRKRACRPEHGHKRSKNVWIPWFCFSQQGLITLLRESKELNKDGSKLLAIFFKNSRRTREAPKDLKMVLWEKEDPGNYTTVSLTNPRKDTGTKLLNN